MKKTGLYILVWLLNMLFLQAQAAEVGPKKTSITISVANAESAVVIVEIKPVSLKARPAIPDQRKIVLNKENTGRVTILLEGPSYIKIMNVWKDSSIHYVLMPGTVFSLKLDRDRRDYWETGQVGQSENDFHNFIIDETERRLKAISQNDPVNYIRQWKEQSDSVLQLIRSAAESGLDTTYTSWDRRNVRSLFYAALHRQLVSYVTVRGLWPANMAEYKANTIHFTSEQLNDPAFFTAEGDEKLVSGYFLFEAVMRYYESDRSHLPSLEEVYSQALSHAKNIKSSDIRNRMLEYLIVSGVKQTNDAGFLKSLRTGFATVPKGKYFMTLTDTKLKLLEIAAAGHTAPVFAAKNPDGKDFSYSDYKGSFIYIDIWATWCLPCIAEFPAMEKLKEKYAGKPVAFISVSSDSRSELWRRFLEDRKMASGHFYSDPSMEKSIRNAYMAKFIPAFILIGPTGKVISPDCYRPSDPAMEMMLDRLLR